MPNLYVRYPEPNDDAFSAALIELFKQYPLWDGAHEMHHAARNSAARKARAGGYRDYTPGRMIYWRTELRDVFAPDWRVPPEEVVTIHALIYG